MIRAGGEVLAPLTMRVAGCGWMDYCGRGCGRMILAEWQRFTYYLMSEVQQCSNAWHLDSTLFKRVELHKANVIALTTLKTPTTLLTARKPRRKVPQTAIQVLRHPLTSHKKGLLNLMPGTKSQPSHNWAYSDDAEQCTGSRPVEPKRKEKKKKTRREIDRCILNWRIDCAIRVYLVFCFVSAAYLAVDHVDCHESGQELIADSYR